MHRRLYTSISKTAQGLKGATGAKMCGNDCFHCAGKTYKQEDLSYQIGSYLQEMKTRRPMMPIHDIACLRLFLTGCTRNSPAVEQEVLSTPDYPVTGTELKENINFITRMCVKYKADRLRIRLSTETNQPESASKSTQPDALVLEPYTEEQCQDMSQARHER